MFQYSALRDTLLSFSVFPAHSHLLPNVDSLIIQMNDADDFEGRHSGEITTKKPVSRENAKYDGDVT